MKRNNPRPSNCPKCSKRPTWEKLAFPAAVVAASISIRPPVAIASFSNVWLPYYPGNYTWSTPDNWLENNVPNSPSATVSLYTGNGSNALQGNESIYVNNQAVGLLDIGTDPDGLYNQTLYPQNSSSVFYMGSSGGTAELISGSADTPVVQGYLPTIDLPLVLSNCNLSITGNDEYVGNIGPNTGDFQSIAIDDGISGGVNLEIKHAYARINAAAGYSGSTTLDGNYATLDVQTSNVLPNSTLVTLSDTTDTFEIDNGDTETVGTIAGSGTLALNSGSTLQTNGLSSTFSGSITGNSASALVLQNGTALTFAAASSSPGFSGTFDINFGTVMGISSGNALGNGTVALRGGTLQINANASASNSIVLDFNSYIDVTSGNTFTVNGKITDAGSQTLLADGPGTLDLANSGNSFHGLTIEGGIVQFSNSGDINTNGGPIEFYGSTGTLELLPGNTVSTSMLVPLALGGGADFTVDSGSNLTVNGTISDVAGDNGVSNFGTGTLVLGGNNSYLGGTTVGGNVSISSDSNLGYSGTPVNFSETLVSFIVGGHRIFIEEPGTLLTTSSFASNRPVTTGPGGGNIDVAPSTILALTGAITGSTGLTKLDTGTLILTGNNSYSGGTTINAGAVEVLASGAAFANTSPIGSGPVTLSGGTLAFEGSVPTSSQQILSIAGGFNQDVVVENTAGSAASLVTTAFDAIGKSTGFDFFEHGYNAQTSGGLPSNHTFASATNAAVSFQLQPYNANNVMLLQPAGSGTSTGTFVLSRPGAYSTISFLAAAANGASSANLDLYFSDGSETVVNENVPDWFSTSPSALPSGTDGRISVVTSQFDSVGTGNPRLYEFDYNLSTLDASKLVTGIGFSDNSGGALGVFALSGYGASAVSALDFGNNVTVTADSTISVGSWNQVLMGGLTIGSNALYVTTPAYNPSGNAVAQLFFLGTNTLNGSATFDVAPSALLNISSPTGSGGITKNNSGELVIDNPAYTGPTTVNGGVMQLYSGSFQNAVITINAGGTLALNTGVGLQTLASLAINGSGVFDVANNHFILSYAPGTQAAADAAIRAYLISGSAGGRWNGPGIDSSAAAAANSAYALGYADGADGIVSGLVSGQIEVKYTLVGDINLDGIVNATDFGIFAAHFGKDVTGWDQGDINYDGVVNGADFGLLASNFGKTASGASIALPSSQWAALDAFAVAYGLLADVPEPTSSASLFLGAIILRRRRR
jgi:autotransporter-associated beta strand protein